MAKEKWKREFVTEYWYGYPHEKKPTTRGYPKAEEGSIEGAAKAVAKGWVAKVRRVHRDTGRVEWTVTRGEKVRGVNIWPIDVVKGDKK
jgi:hypothetical protein